MKSNTPDNRCGFTVDYYEEELQEADITIQGPGSCTCWRPVWDNHNRCIWHADEDGKPIKDLANPRTSVPERLDQAILRGIPDVEDISFSNCVFRNSDLNNSKFRKVDFSRCDLTKVEAKKSKFSSVNFEGSKMTETKFYRTSIIRSWLKNSNLKYANLHRASVAASNLENACLESSVLSDANFWKSDLSGANISDAKLEETKLNDATLTGVNLEDSYLVNTDIRNTDMKCARIFNTYLSDIRLNTDTDFGDICVYEQLEELDEWDATPLEAAVWCYGRLQTIHEEYAQTDRARHYHTKKANALRQHHWKQNHRSKWLVYAINGIISKHNESPRRVIESSLILISFWSILYFLFGQIRVSNNPQGTSLIGLGRFPTISIPDVLSDILLSIYFSSVTFTTLGYADVQPANGITQFLAMTESFLGALLIALLVFVLGRRTTW